MDIMMKVQNVQNLVFSVAIIGSCRWLQSSRMLLWEPNYVTWIIVVGLVYAEDRTIRLGFKQQTLPSLCPEFPGHALWDLFQAKVITILDCSLIDCSYQRPICNCEPSNRQNPSLQRCCEILAVQVLRSAVQVLRSAGENW